MDIATIAAKYLSNPDDILNLVAAVREELDNLPAEIDKLVDARNEVRSPVTVGKPNVRFVIARTDKGNLRVSYLPEHPSDFGQEYSEYSHHDGYDPVNSLLFFRGFNALWGAQVETSPDAQVDLIFALERDLVAAVVGIVKDAEARLARHCHVISRCEFVRDASGNFHLLSSQEVAAREREKAVGREAEIRYRTEAPMRQRRELLERWKEQYGMDPRKIVALIDAFHPCRVPFDGRTEILVRHFDMKGPPSALHPGTVRSIKNTLTSLGEALPEAAIPLAEARALARKYLGRIRG